MRGRRAVRRHAAHTLHRAAGSAWLSDLFQSFTAEEVAAPAQPAEPGLTITRGSAVTPNTAAYRFTPQSNELVIEFAAREAGATLLVRKHDEAEAALELSSEGSTPGVLILPAGVRIGNAQSSGTTYRLLLPQAAGSLSIRFGSRLLRTIDTATLSSDRDLQINVNPE